MTALLRLMRTTSARIIAGYLLVTIVLSGAWLYSLSGPLTSTVAAQQQRNLLAVAQSSALVVMESDQQPQQIARQLVARTDLRLTIVAADGTVLADSDSPPHTMENHANRPEIRSALGGSTGVARRTSATEGYEQIYVAVPGSLGDERVAVRVSQSLEEVGLIAARLRRFGLVLLAVALAAAALIAWRATRLASRPVQELTATSQEMAQGNLAVTVPRVPADLEILAESLTALRNQMKSRLDALDTERHTLKAALDGLADAVLVVESGTVVLSNQAVLPVLSLQRVPAEGTALDELAIPASLKSAIMARLTLPVAAEIELDPDPAGRAWRVVVAPMPSRSGASRSIVVVSALTERVTLDRVRREFVSNASHELKTPVAGIKLLADSAAMAAADGDIEDSAIFLSQISGEVERLQRLVSDLLDLSRLETLQSPGSTTDVRTAIQNASAGHGAAAQRKDLALVVDLSAIIADDVYVAADPTDVAIALDNLLANAIHYTESGSVTITVRVTGDRVMIEIADTGTGIAAEHLPRIFERFYRADEGRARDAGGTGLGLALVRNAAERNSGSVSVTSHVGSGSTFVLTLPRHT
ncbi:MAG: ATP-binding protein [Coriobacteriia bacterium]